MNQPGSAGRFLKHETAARHQSVDEVYARFRLDDRCDYTAFLMAHGRALAPLEQMAGPGSARMALLASDLAALGEAVPETQPRAVDADDAYRWGVLYVLEGSRLGGAVLRRKVGETFPTAYLGATHAPGGWARFLRRMDDQLQSGGAAWLLSARAGAHMAFDLFERSGRAALSERIAVRA